MLPALPDTDIFDHQPDSDDIDVLADGFGVNSLPRGVGVYCFYDPKTGAPHYVGSGCGVDPHGTKNCGLVLRIKLYRRPRHVHDLKIHNAIVASGLRLKVWITRNEGDARKYEADAVRKYMPPLNVAGCRRETEEQRRDRVNARTRKQAADRKLNYSYDAEKKKRCGRCKLIKKCKLFRKSAGKPLHVVGRCKKCEAELRAVASGRLEPGPQTSAPC